MLHGKEGVDGSSPSEGFTKAQQMAFFVASSGWWGLHFNSKTCPQNLSPECDRLQRSGLNRSF